MIVAITIVRDEVAVIELPIRHLLAHGIDRILVIDHRSEDGTRDVLARLAAETGKIDVDYEDGRVFYQANWFNRLIARAASIAGVNGAMTASNPICWILPFDADEIFIPLTKATLAEEFQAAGHGVLRALRWPHASMKRRARTPIGIGKVAFSWDSTAAIHSHGAHHVVHPGPTRHGLIEIRERMYLSEAHYIAKTRKHIESLRMNRVPSYLRKRGSSLRRLKETYAAWVIEASAVYDPIPLRGAANEISNWSGLTRTATRIDTAPTSGWRKRRQPAISNNALVWPIW